MDQFKISPEEINRNMMLPSHYYHYLVTISLDNGDTSGTSLVINQPANPMYSPHHLFIVHYAWDKWCLIIACKWLASLDDRG